MKRSSPFQIVLLCTFGALAIAGVLIFSFYISKGGTSSIGSVTIWGPFDEITVQGALGQLMDSHSDLQNAHYVRKDPATYMSDLTNALASGTGPDLFFLTQDEAYAQAPRILAIDNTTLPVAQFESTFIDGAAPFTGAAGTYALPILADPLVMYWNKDILTSKGYAQPPQYWDEMFDFSQKVTVKTEAGEVQTAAIDFGTYNNVDHAKDILSMLIMQAGGAVTIRDVNGRLISGLMAKSGGDVQQAAVPSALRFYTEFADPSKDDYTWNRAFPDGQTAFSQGKLALYIGRVSEADAIRAANPNLNFAVAPVPQVRASDPAKTPAIDTGTIYGVAIPRTAKNPKGAYVIQLLLASADVSKTLSTALALPSARRDVLDAVRKKPGDLQMSSYEAIIMRSWTDPDPDKTDDIFRAMIEDTTSGALLLNEAIARAEQQINNVIGI
ncbi:MAG: extracellular solute-binding protein [Candidatus Kaiserbacteria bacterium]|nr:extracellular solute-binding protein [Candidatus Kaiserbacteria bacterium]